MDKFKLFWSTLPTPQQAVVVGVVLLVLLFVAGGIGGLVSSWKDARFDARESEREQQRQVLETERNEAIGRAQAAEERAKNLEGQTRVLEVTVDAFGKQAENIKEKITDEEKRLQSEIAGIDDNADTCTRLLRLCERAKSLNLYPKSKECRCE